MAGPVGVYISVPFCKAKCTFCNFASGVFGAERMQQLCGSPLRGDSRCAGSGTGMGRLLPRAVDTVYFGGGTPSLLSAQQFRQIFRAVFAVSLMWPPMRRLRWSARLGSLADETLEELLRQGMNRISFGVQSFVDRESAAVGRLHTERAVRGGVCAGACGWCSRDQRRSDCGASSSDGAELAVFGGSGDCEWCSAHVSVYMLEVDDESRLGREMLEQGTRYGASAVPSEDEAAELVSAGVQTLDAAGVHQYEISNFARPGHRSRHNLKYWRRQPYIGFGLDAHSMLSARARVLYGLPTPSDLDGYLGTPLAQTPFRVLEVAAEGYRAAEI